MKIQRAHLDKGVRPVSGTCGLYYKRITIVIDAASVTLQIVVSLTIVIDDAS